VETPEQVLESTGREAARSLLTDALTSLYEDRIKPSTLSVKGRLKERGTQDSILRCFVEIYRLLPDSFSVTPSAAGGNQADECSIEFVKPPEGFKGWIDIDAPDDPYDEALWKDFAEYLKTGCEFAGGRYGMARELHKRSLPFLSKFSLGEVCHMVQLAIAKRKLVIYHKKVLRTPDQAFKDADGLGARKGSTTNGDAKPVTDLRQLGVLLSRMCIRRKNTGLRLEQLRKTIQEEHGFRINEMDFQCTKLSELFKRDPLSVLFEIQSDGGAMRVFSRTLDAAPQSARDIHAEAAELEASRPRRSRSRSRSPSGKPR